MLFRAIAEEIISHLKSSEYLCVCGTCKKNSNKRIQEIAAIISRHLSASVPDSAFTPKHLGFPEQSPRVCIKCGHGGTPKGERCTFGYIGPDVDAGCGCQCEFPASPSITDQ